MVKWVGLVAATAGLVGLVLTPACAAGGDDVTSSTSSSGTGGDAGAGGVGGQGGASSGTGGATGGSGGGSSGGNCLPSDGVLLAWDSLFLGDTDWAHAPSPSAWEQYGFDVDGITTVNDFSNHCQPFAGANPATAFPDGDDGIDNSFGQNAMPLFDSLVPNISDQANLALQSGEFTMMLLLEGLDSADADPLTTKLWGGASFAGQPAWDGTDCWSVLYEDLTDPNDIDTPKVQFPNSQVTGDFWESVDTATVVVPITFAGTTMPMVIRHARASMQLAPSHQGAALGLIGGVVETEELVESVRDVMGAIDPSLCSGTTFDSVADQLRQASDIMLDGTQDPNQTCNAISIGLGYTMLPVGLEGVAPEATTPTDPCP